MLFPTSAIPALVLGETGASEGSAQPLYFPNYGTETKIIHPKPAEGGKTGTGEAYLSCRALIDPGEFQGKPSLR